jgi:hypothetical protein
MLIQEGGYESRETTDTSTVLKGPIIDTVLSFLFLL